MFHKSSAIIWLLLTVNRFTESLNKCKFYRILLTSSPELEPFYTDPSLYSLLHPLPDFRVNWATMTNLIIWFTKIFYIGTHQYFIWKMMLSSLFTQIQQSSDYFDRQSLHGKPVYTFIDNIIAYRTPIQKCFHWHKRNSILHRLASL